MDESKLQQTIQQEIQNYFTTQGGAKGTGSTSFHRHTGAGDGPQIRLSDTLPFTFMSVLPTNQAIAGAQSNYLIGTLVPIDYGIYSYMGNTWNQISYYAAGVGAHLSAVQSIPNNTPTLLIFDTVDWDDSGEYDSTTGIYETITVGRFLISAQVTITGGGTLSLVQDNGGGPVVVGSAFNNGTGSISIAFTQVRNLGSGLQFWFEVTQTSGGALNAQATNTFLSVKKFMN